MSEQEQGCGGCDYMKYLFGAVMGAAIVIPSIAIGFYSIYQMVAWLGNS